MCTSQTYIHMTGDEIDQIFIEMLFYYSKILNKQSRKQVFEFFFFDRNERKKDVKEKEKEEKKEGQVKLHIINLYAHRLLI